MTAGARRFWGLAALAIALAVADRAGAATNSGYAVDHGIAVYYAVVPAELVRGHPQRHAETEMHGGVPEGTHEHHVMVALFKAANFDRIVDAKVMATVGEIGLSVQQKPLEPFSVAGALTYGNYFNMQQATDYRIRIDAVVPGFKNPARIEFDYKHQ